MIDFIKKNKILVIILVIFFLLFFGIWKIVDEGYDKQNKTILFLKKIIPSKISRHIRDTVFIIPDLKERNKFLSNIIKKYDQGLNGNLFNEEIVISEKNNKKYSLKEFFLPFKRFDGRLGWAGTKNSRRAHHLAIVDDNVIVISGEGKTIYFKKNNILKHQLNQKEISNNINDILAENNFDLIGIRDLFLDEGKIYISLIFKSPKGFSINAYRADVNFKKLNFELFFQPNEYWNTYNVYSGGRFAKYKDERILFSIGYSGVKKAAQNENSYLGKIISINKLTKEVNIFSMGHRNPQGLVYIKETDIVINTEHGPKGGDEINLNFRNTNQIPNFGWDVSSYGTKYNGTDPYKKSHEDYGFIEPFKYYVPSIGISQLVYIPRELSSDNKKYLFVSSLRANSIYKIEINDQFNEIINEDRIYFSQRRIRDIEFDKENNVFLIMFELIPSIGILKLN
tara:strand:- start:656 stop:2014 length:1359 start_codon:yes stop_codon:yes gene_type:complete